MHLYLTCVYIYVYACMYGCVKGKGGEAEVNRMCGNKITLSFPPLSFSLFLYSSAYCSPTPTNSLLLSPKKVGHG